MQALIAKALERQKNVFMTRTALHIVRHKSNRTSPRRIGGSGNSAKAVDEESNRSEADNAKGKTSTNPDGNFFYPTFEKRI